MEIKRIGVLTSGGDAPGMNTAIRAIVRSANYYGIEVYGINDGYLGLIKEDFIKFNRKDVSDISSRGGTILGSARFVEFKEESVRLQAVEILKKHKIDALICIGGDGTYMGAYKLSLLGIPCIGVPGTIDNDIVSTEYTIGFDTTLNTIVEAVDKLRDTTCSHHRCSVVEVMGRYNPDLAIRAGIACGAEEVITCKEDYSDEKIINVAHEAKKAGKRNCIIIVCEHTIDVNHIEKVLNDDGTYETRATVLGHIQRGGIPSAFDRILAARLGDYAVRLLKEGKTGVCVGVKGETLTHMDIDEANKLPKKKPVELIEQFKHLI
ncbi:MAG: 6-phosphofructokinase [Erysipelotrichaceae bacterium]|nr:6-phosphofructokinase [Erysipelotrichaceae bacterium]